MQHPDDDGGREDDGEGLLHKALGLFPDQLAHALGAGQAVVGQLHDKGHGLPGKGGVLEDQGVDHAAENAQGVQPNHRHRLPGPGEEGGDQHGINRQLGRAAHEGGQQNGHLPVPLAGERPGGHDRRNGTAEANEHGHEAAARKAQLPKRPVHDEGHTGHIARILQNGQEEEQRHNGGQKAQHTAHTGADAVHHQAMDHGVDVPGGEACINEVRHPAHAQLHQIGQGAADDGKGQNKHQGHDPQKAGNGCEPAGEYPVNGHAALVLLALVGPDHGLSAQGLQEAEAHIGHGRLPVQARLLLHDRHDLPEGLLLFRV